MSNKWSYFPKGFIAEIHDEPMDLSDIYIPDFSKEPLTPSQIKKELDKFIVGQDNAKMAVSILGYNCMQRKTYAICGGNDLIKSNLLLIGNTGSGKTYLLEKLRDIVDVGVLFYDVTAITKRGFQGDDADKLIKQFVNQFSYEKLPPHVDINNFVDYVQQQVEYGIIFLDEIDKIRSNPANNSSGQDINGTGVQQDLLKLIEGVSITTTVQNPFKLGGKETITIDTKNIVFVGGGAFGGLEEIVSKRLTGQEGMGFNATVRAKLNRNDILATVNQLDLVQYGFLNEFTGRFHSYVPLSPLSRDLLLKILAETKGNVISRYQELFRTFNKELVFTDNALNAIADVAISLDLGARSLHTVVEKILGPFQFHYPDDRELSTILIGSTNVKDAWPGVKYATN